MKDWRPQDQRIQTQAMPFRRPHAHDSIESVVFVLVMVCHDRVEAGVEVCEFNDGRPSYGLYCVRFEALLFIGKRVRRIEKKNADGL